MYAGALCVEPGEYLGRMFVEVLYLAGSIGLQVSDGDPAVLVAITFLSQYPEGSPPAILDQLNELFPGDSVIVVSIVCLKGVYN